MVWKLSLPASKKITVLAVLNRVYPRALRLAAWNNPFNASSINRLEVV